MNRLNQVPEYVPQSQQKGPPPTLVGLDKMPIKTPRKRGGLPFPVPKRLDLTNLHVPTEPDTFFDSQLVHSLNDQNFVDFLSSKEVTLVMFYFPNDPQTEVPRMHFSAAAGITKRENHAYAAVNCDRTPVLCFKEEILQTNPAFKLYSRAAPVGTIRVFSTFTFDTMKKFVENAPVLDEYRRPKFPCEGKENKDKKGKK